MPKDTRTATVPLTMLRFSTRPERIDEGCCLACDHYLDLNQPDASHPDRLVGTCGRCGRWYIIDMVPGTDDAVMALLPEIGFFEGACRP